MIIIKTKQLIYERVERMYGVSQMVVYGIHGVCRIVQMEERTVDRQVVSYYVLEPLSQPGTRYLIPSHNPAALAKLRPLLDRERLMQMLDAAPHAQDWIADENRRKQYYRQIITSGDAAALINMVHCLENYKQAQAEAGRRLHLCDENFLRDAQKVLDGEISVVLDIPEKDVAAYMRSIVE